MESAKIASPIPPNIKMVGYPWRDFMNPLILPMKDKYYWMIRKDEKTHEYREAKPYWTSRIHGQEEIIFKPGYCPSSDWDVKAKIISIKIIHFDELPDYVKKEFGKSDYDNYFDIEFEKQVRDRITP